MYNTMIYKLLYQINKTMETTKKHFFWILLMTILLTSVFSETISAQQRRRTSTARRTTTVRKLTTTTNTAAKKKQTSGKFGCYEIPTSLDYAWCDESGLYYVEREYLGNAVRFISIETGQLSTLLPSNKGIYEGGHIRIDEIFTYNNNVYLCGHDGWIYLYDRANKGLTKIIGGINTILNISPNGRYMIALREAGGAPLRTEVIDIEAKGYVVYLDDLWKNNILITNNDLLWGRFTETDDMGRALRNSISLINIITGKNLKVPYISFDYYKNNSFFEVFQQSTWLGNDGFLYFAHGRRLYRINATSPGDWEEYLKIPPTIDDKFTDEEIMIDSKGNVLLAGEKSYLFKANDRDNPVLLSHGLADAIQSDARPSHAWTGTGCFYPSLALRFCDKYDNFIFAYNNVIDIYNPNGIKGWPNAKGRYCEIK